MRVLMLVGVVLSLFSCKSTNRTGDAGEVKSYVSAGSYQLKAHVHGSSTQWQCLNIGDNDTVDWKPCGEAPSFTVTVDSETENYIFTKNLQRGLSNSSLSYDATEIRKITKDYKARLKDSARHVDDRSLSSLFK